MEVTKKAWVHIVPLGFHWILSFPFYFQVWPPQPPPSMIMNHPPKVTSTKGANMVISSTHVCGTITRVEGWDKGFKYLCNVIKCPSIIDRIMLKNSHWFISLSSKKAMDHGVIQTKPMIKDTMLQTLWKHKGGCKTI